MQTLQRGRNLSLPYQLLSILTAMLLILDKTKAKLLILDKKSHVVDIRQNKSHVVDASWKQCTAINASLNCHGGGVNFLPAVEISPEYKIFYRTFSKEVLGLLIY